MTWFAAKAFSWLEGRAAARQAAAWQETAPSAPAPVTAVALRACPGCGTDPHRRHDSLCPEARCMFTGCELALCRVLHMIIRNPSGVGHDGIDCHPDNWTGLDAAAGDAVRFGLFCRPRNGNPVTGWPVTCGPGDPQARPDTTALVVVARWQPLRQRWELPALVWEPTTRPWRWPRPAWWSPGDGGPPKLVAVHRRKAEVTS